MSLHDTYARLTPFEIAFPDAGVVDRLSESVASAVAGRGGDDTVLETFMTTEAVGILAREIRGPEAPPESTYPFAALLFHAVHFVRAGRPLYLAATDTVRRLVQDGSPGRFHEPPASSGYLQLPQHLVWTTSAAPGAGRATPESLDGVFWTVSASGLLHALPISGVLPDGPGFGALPLPAAPLADAPIWLQAAVRPSGQDFASALPGGALDRLYGVQAAGEVLKLLARFFAALPSADVTRAQPLAAAAPGGPRPSALPYTRVSLAE